MNAVEPSRLAVPTQKAGRSKANTPVPEVASCPTDEIAP